MLAIAVSIAAVSSREKRLAGVNKNSMQAFQVAESGAEIVMKKMKNASPGQTIRDVFTTCNNGKVNGDAVGGTYTVTFLGQDDKVLGCDESIEDAMSFKSVGNYSGTLRAIQTAMVP